jgi:iron complex outermembrane receptor protein
MQTPLRASLLLVFSPLSFAAAQAKQDSSRALPPVTITATRAGTSVLTTPLAISRIEAPDLRAVNGYGIEDALARVPGVIAQSRYGTSDVRLVIRGFGARGAGDRSNSGTSRGVRVLLDGFPETEPDGRTAFDQVDLATAEALEVVRSNASALWGNAAGGVLNVLSVPAPGPPSLELQSVVGGFGLRRYIVRAAAPLGDGVTWMNVTNSTFGGWRSHSDARRMLVNAGVSAGVGAASTIGVYLVAANNLMHVPGPLTRAQVDANPSQAHPDYLARDERRYNRLGRLGVSLDHTFDSGTSISTRLFVNPKYLQRSERNTFRDFTRYHVGGSVLARHDLAIGSTRSRLVAGVDEAYQDGSIQFYALAAGSTRGALRDDKSEGAQNLGVFLQDELALSDRLSLVLGGRYDRVAYTYRSFLPTAPVKSQSKDFTRVSPKIGASWLLGRTSSVYANIGGGIEVPAGNETDPTPTGATPGALLNPLLDAIRSTTYEIGAKSPGIALAGASIIVGYDVALYRTNVQNEIIPYGGGRYYQTAGLARRSGLEIGATASSAAGPFVRAALSLNDHRYTRYVVDSAVVDASKAGNTVDFSGNRVMGVPRVTSNVEIGSELPGLRVVRLAAALEHSGAYFADDGNTVAVPAYTIWNVTADLNRPLISANGIGVRGFVTLHNATNRRYIGSAFLNPDLVDGRPAAFEPGMPRTLMVSLTVGRLR